MTSDIPQPEEPAKQPILNAPMSVVALAASLLATHGLTQFLSVAAQNRLLDRFALFPARSFAPADSRYSYDGAIEALAPIFAHGWLHADWMHVGLNAVFCLAFGAPVARACGPWRFLVIYLASLVGGAMTYLAFNIPDADNLSIAIGASGAVSGLTGAAFLLMRGGRLLNSGFMGMTAVFVGGNILLALAGPATFGVSIAWQAHIGGYVAGALVLRAMLGDRV